MKVFICDTNYHLILAQLIIKKYKFSNYVILSCVDVGPYKSQSQISTKKMSLRLIKKLISLRGKVTGIYVANPKKLKNRIILKLIYNQCELYTYDDGIGSMCGRGYFYENDQSKLKQVLLTLLFEPQYIDLINDRVINHFTIYKYGTPPCSKKTVLLEVDKTDFYPSPLKDNGLSKQRLIILGSAYVEDKIISREDYADLVRCALKYFNGSYQEVLYYCHPREDDNKLKHIASDIIVVRNSGPAESYVLSLNTKGPIVGIGSSAVVHLNILGFTNTFYINPLPEFKSMVKFIADNNVKVINIDA